MARHSVSEAIAVNTMPPALASVHLVLASSSVEPDSMLHAFLDPRAFSASYRSSTRTGLLIAHRSGDFSFCRPERC